MPNAKIIHIDSLRTGNGASKKEKTFSDPAVLQKARQALRHELPGLVIVFFWMPTCSQSVTMKDNVEQVAREMQVEFILCDCSESGMDELALGAGVRDVPTTIIPYGDKEAIVIGLINKNKILAHVEEIMGNE